MKTSFLSFNSSNLVKSSERPLTRISGGIFDDDMIMISLIALIVKSLNVITPLNYFRILFESGGEDHLRCFSFNQVTSKTDSTCLSI